jgi:molybdate transport system substrate-binding protein
MASRGWILMAFLVAATGCGTTNPGPEQVDPAALRVAAASDLQGVLPTLADRFTASSGVVVTPVFGASGQLAQQVRQGAPYDVFLSANMDYIRALVKEGLIDPDSARAYARGRLVLVVNRASGIKVEKPSDLMRPEVKHVAIANPEFAPYGLAARQALQKARLWDDLRPKLVPAESVRQALQYVQTGNAEAGLVAHSVAGVPEVQSVEVDSGLYEPILQGLGVVTRSSRRENARQFAGFVIGDSGQSVLASFGFDPAPGKGGP